MELEPRKPTARGPADWFTGDVYIDPIAQGHGATRVGIALVRFTPGARTAWHTHSVGQTLHVTEGQGRIQARGKPSSPSVPETRSSPPAVSGTGTVLPPITTCPISLSAKVNPSGATTSPTASTRAADARTSSEGSWSPCRARALDGHDRLTHLANRPPLSTLGVAFGTAI